MSILNSRFVLGGIVAATCLMRADVILTDSTFAAVNWSAVAVNATNGASMTLLGPIPANGLNVQVANFFAPPLTAGTSGSATSAFINTFFTYDPSSSGAILGLTLGYDLRFNGSNGFSGGAVTPFVAPVLRQGGQIFQLAGVSDRNTTGSFVTFSNSSTLATQWVVFGGTANPDFSSAGSRIEFGWRAGLSSSCPSGGQNCGSSSAGLQFDNFSVNIQNSVPATVPEPSTGAVVLGVGAFAMAANRLRTARHKPIG